VFGGIFKYIQEFQGFISPGILAVFVFGLLVHKAPAICGVVGLVVNPIIYGLLKVLAPNLAFLDRMAVCFFVVLGLMALITFLKPLEKPVELPVQTRIALESSPGAKMAGIAVVVVTLVLYGVFW
jgi:SSS family solute:Na+ symporter